MLAAKTEPSPAPPGEELVHIMEVLPNGFSLLLNLQGLPHHILPRIVPKIMEVLIKKVQDLVESLFFSYSLSMLHTTFSANPK